MDYELTQLSDIDVFFFYGEKGSNLQLETQSDILGGIMQPKRTMYYNRGDSSGVADKENMPNGAVLAILARYSVVQWVAYRNTQVSDGTNGNPDRRVAVSQNSVSIDSNNKGELNVSVGYIPFTNFKEIKSVSMPIARGV